jgi:hypothetical protein
MNIVLVHGILGFREKFGIEYFRSIAESGKQGAAQQTRWDAKKFPAIALVLDQGR